MVQATRGQLLYGDLSERYVLQSSDLAGSCFHRQFIFLYRERVRSLRARIISAAKEKLGAKVEPVPLMSVEKKAKVLVIGIIIKRIQQRPSVLKSIAAHELILPDAVIDENLLGNEDYLELEDEDQHVHLCGVINMNDVATGCVVGLYGVLARADVFEVHDIIWPTMAPQPSLPSLNDDKYVMFVSGISIGGASDCEAENLFCLDLLQKWLGGYLPVSEKEQSIVENLCRLVVAGESIAITDQGKEYATLARYLIKTEECPNIECAALVDTFLSKLTNALEVDLMPGSGDPATHLMPQQPMHRAVFPKASQHGTMLNLVTNPYEFSLQGIHILGSSGQNVNDLKRFWEGSESSSIDLLKNLLCWQHMAPTVPDTIDGFPFENRDPLIIEDAFPHIFFAGNQNQAEYATVEFDDGRQALLLSVPKFSKTKSALIVNLRTLEVIEQSFGFDSDI